ncbi:MAG: hypothetical protein AAGF33_18750 [Pseudomonadota bacterium]
MTNGSYEPPGRVIAVLTECTVRFLLQPGYGLADGGIPTEVPLDVVPPELRMPNTMLTVTVENGNTTNVRARDIGT